MLSLDNNTCKVRNTCFWKYCRAIGGPFREGFVQRRVLCRPRGHAVRTDNSAAGDAIVIGCGEGAMLWRRSLESIVGVYHNQPTYGFTINSIIVTIDIIPTVVPAVNFLFIKHISRHTAVATCDCIPSCM